MRIVLFIVLAATVGCSTKNDSPMPDQEGAAERPEEQAPVVETPEEDCLKPCMDSMAMQARSAESIRDECIQRCSGEAAPLAPVGLE